MSKDFKDKNGDEKMNTEITANEKDKGDLVLFEIPDETIAEVIAIGDEAPIWVKVVDGGFWVNDKTVPEITGVICDIDLHLMMWKNKQPHRLDNVLKDSDIPEGYQRRANLKIMVNSQFVGISLAKSSLKSYFSPYVQYLKTKGLRPDNVFTRLKVKADSNAYGTFNVVFFEMVGPANDVTPQQPQQPKPLIESEKETPPVIPSEWA